METVTPLPLTSSSTTPATDQTTWRADPMHSGIHFAITHMGIAEVNGWFKDYSVTATTSRADFSDAVFEFSVDVASLDTNIELRDNHLRSPEFFDVETFPRMTLKSTAINKVSEAKYTLTGDLTLHGMTKPITLDLWFRGLAMNPMTNAETAGFQLTGVIRRLDFGIGTTYPPPGLSDQVTIKADGEFVKQ